MIGYDNHCFSNEWIEQENERVSHSRIIPSVVASLTKSFDFPRWYFLAHLSSFSLLIVWIADHNRSLSPVILQLQNLPYLYHHISQLYQIRLHHGMLLQYSNTWAAIVLKAQIRFIVWFTQTIFSNGSKTTTLFITFVFFHSQPNTIIVNYPSSLWLTFICCSDSCIFNYTCLICYIHLIQFVTLNCTITTTISSVLKWFRMYIRICI